MSEMDDFDFVFPDDRTSNPAAGLPEPSRERMKELAALADGSLRSDEIRAQIESDPEADALLDEQRRAVALVRDTAGQVRAPDALRERLAALAPEGALERSGPRRDRRSASRTVGRGRGRLLAGLAAAAVLLLVVVVALSSSGTSGSPTVAQTAALAGRPATLPAPRQTAARSWYVNLSEAGVPFPYWEDHFHWEAVGARTDTLSGRTVTTVYYTDHHSRHLAYAIVSGPALPAPKGSHEVVHNGVPLWVSGSGQTTIVTWERAGHSCVLAARGVSTAALVRLASWRTSGAVPA